MSRILSGWLASLARLQRGCGKGPTWSIRTPRLVANKSVHRVVIDLAGRSVWFESVDVPLRPAPEAVACLALIPALHFSARVLADSVLDPFWLANAHQLVHYFAKWWDYPDTFPIVARQGLREGLHAPANGTGLCFTGGVDSFHSLLRGAQHIDRLIFVHGFDITLRDETRMTAFRRVLERVGAAAQSRPIVVRTNLREHPVFGRVSWERTHGAALAAVGHLLSGSLGRLVIASSFSTELAHPWGSHFQTDPLWSSQCLQIIHDAPTLARLDKVPQIAAEPLLWNNLRVCWKNHAPAGNCSRCEKCLRTMCMLTMAGQLQKYSVFETVTPLARLLDKLPALPARLVPRWEILGVKLAEPELRAAIARLVARSCRS